MFDELKIKRIIKKGYIKYEDYISLSDKIKKDIRVKDILISSSSKNINYFEIGDILKYIIKDFKLIKHINNDMLYEVINKLVEINSNYKERVYTELTILQKKFLLNNNIKFYLSLIENNKLHDAFWGDIKQISSDINEIFCELNNDQILNLIKSNSLNENREIKIYISNLSFERQYEIYKYDKEFFDFFSEEIQSLIKSKEEEKILETINDDIIKVFSLPSELQIKYFKTNIDKLQYASYEIKQEILKEGDVNLSLEDYRKISYVDNVYYERLNSIYVHNVLDDKDIIEHLTSAPMHIIEYIDASSINNIDSIKFIIETKLSELLNEELKGIYIKLKHEYFDHSKNNYMNFHHNETHPICLFISLLYEEEIIKKNNANILEEFVKTGDKKLLIQILSNTYGEHVYEIFNNKPRLDIKNIPPYCIFSEEVINSLGINFVNYMLSYNFSVYNYEISLISKNKEEREIFKKIYQFTLERNNNINAPLLYEIFERFVLYKDLIKKIDFKSLTEEEKNNLELLFNDEYFLSSYINDSKDITNYVNIRKKIYIEKVYKNNDITSIKNIIFSYLTGRTVQERSNTIESFGLKSVLRVFNVDRVLKDDKLIDKIGLTNEEVAMLLLINKINDINNENVLLDVVSAIFKTKTLNPTKFKNTFQKIKSYYSEQFKNNLTNNNDLLNNKQEEINGVRVVNFEGEEFNLLVSVTGLNLSDIPNVGAFHGKELLDDWLNKENGTSTISCTLCSSDINIEPVPDFSDNYIAFVFDKDVDIISMGGSDISISHIQRQAKHGYGVTDSKLSFQTMDEIKDNSYETKKEYEKYDIHKFINEIAITRRNEDLESKNALKRQMPRGLYVVGEITDEILETAEVFKKYYEEHDLGEFIIYKINPSKYSSYIPNNKPISNSYVESNDALINEVEEIVRGGL